MRTATIAFLLSLFVAAALTPLLRSFARRRGLLDHAVGSRKIHGRPVPRLGGIAIVLGSLAPFVGLFVYRTSLGEQLYANRTRALAFLGGGLAIALLGLYDDLRGSSALKKLAVQTGVALALYHFGYRIEVLATPLGVAVPLGALALPLTVLWIIGVINAMNLIDGLDGLAGGVALFALGTNFVIAAYRGDPFMAFFTAALGGAVLGFLFYNFNPASIFMGDTGSMFLGFVLAAGSIQTSQKSSTAVALLVPMVALGLPIADTLFAIARRALRGRPLFSADKEHIHHKLLALGLTQRQAVVTLYAACGVLGAAALALSFANSFQTAAVLTGLSAVGWIALRRLGMMKGPPSQRRRNREIRGAVRLIGERLGRAASVDEVWEMVRPFGAAVGAQAIALEIAGADGSSVRRRVEIAPAGLEPLRVQFPLVGAAVESLGALELSWADGRTEVERDHEIAAEVLCDHIAGALERIAPPTEPARIIPLKRG